MIVEINPQGIIHLLNLASKLDEDDYEAGEYKELINLAKTINKTLKKNMEVRVVIKTDFAIVD